MGVVVCSNSYTYSSLLSGHSTTRVSVHICKNTNHGANENTIDTIFSYCCSFFFFCRSSFNSNFFSTLLLHSSFVFGTPSHEIRKSVCAMQCKHCPQKTTQRKKWPCLLALYYRKLRNQFCIFPTIFLYCENTCEIELAIVMNFRYSLKMFSFTLISCCCNFYQQHTHIHNLILLFTPTPKKPCPFAVKAKTWLSLREKKNHITIFSNWSLQSLPTVLRRCHHWVKAAAHSCWCYFVFWFCSAE